MASASQHIFSRLWSRYTTCLTTHPYTTNAITTGVIIGIGDTIAQSIERRNHAVVDDHAVTSTSTTSIDTRQQATSHVATKWNPMRTAIMGSWGLLGFGPFFTYWFRLYTPGNRGQRFAAPTTSNILAKVLFTSIAAIPVNSVFFVYATTCEHHVHRYQLKASQPHQQQQQQQHAVTADNHYDKLFNDISDRFRYRFLHVMMASWIFWAPCNFINWKYVPLRWRMVFSANASVAWNTFLSLQQHKSNAPTKTLKPSHLNLHAATST
jgi:hypothetical protein